MDTDLITSNSNSNIDNIGNNLNSKKKTTTNEYNHLIRINRKIGKELIVNEEYKNNIYKSLRELNKIQIINFFIETKFSEITIRSKPEFGRKIYDHLLNDTSLTKLRELISTNDKNLLNVNIKCLLYGFNIDYFKVTNEINEHNWSIIYGKTRSKLIEIFKSELKIKVLTYY